jgi:hypothetical protein
MTVRRLFAALLLLALFAMAVRATLDPDMWWHLRTGELILGSGIPRQDPFSLTAAGRPWVTHEWLSQVFMWSLYQLGGLPALMLTFAAFAAAAHWLTYQASEGRPYIAGFITLLAAMAASIVWDARPQLFNLLLAGVVIYVVEGWRHGRLSTRLLWLLVPVIALWANLHSGYLFGVALLATYAIGESARRWLLDDAQALGPQQIRTLTFVTASGFLASALNPSGLRLWLYPFETLGSNAMQTYIQEWHSPDFHVPIFWAFGALLALGLVGFAFSDAPLTVTDLLLFLGTGAAGLQSARNIPLFALVATPILARHWVALAATSPRFAAVTAPVRNGGGGGLIRWLNWALVTVAVLAVGVWAAEKVATNSEQIAARYPEAAIDFLESEGLEQSRLFNTYGWGGYLIWRGLPAYVDGRADVYGDALLRTYVQTADLAPGWREPLEDWSIELILIEEEAPLAVVLAETVGWREIYADGLARVFAREGR